jgi:hypothetical protein
MLPLQPAMAKLKPAAAAVETNLPEVITAFLHPLVRILYLV